MHTPKNILRAVIAAAILSALTAGGFAQQPTTGAAPGQPAEKKKQVKDQGEYDIFNEALKDVSNPQKEIQDLDSWKQKYPDSDYKWDRLHMYMVAYGSMQPPQPPKVVEYGTQLMSQDLKTIFNDANGQRTILDILFRMTTSIPALPNPTPEQADLGRKAANQLKQEADAFFVAANKPANTPDAAWQKAKTDLTDAANRTLLALDILPANQLMTKHDPKTAEAEHVADCAAAEPMYVKALQDHPQSGFVAYQLANALVCQQKKDPSKVPQAIYEFERAAVTDPSLKLNDYADSLYKRVHGDDTGLAQLKEQVKQNPLPPAGFEIKSKEQLAAEKEAEFNKNNPRLALWNGIKGQLTAPDGEQYFTDKLKDSAVPELRGTVVEGKPSCRSREILVYVPGENPQGQHEPEITIKLDAPLSGKPEAGSEIIWQGVPTAFTKSPFMLTMDAEKSKVQVKTSACAAAPVHKKSAGKKK